MLINNDPLVTEFTERIHSNTKLNVHDSWSPVYQQEDLLDGSNYPSFLVFSLFVRLFVYSLQNAPATFNIVIACHHVKIS